MATYYVRKTGNDGNTGLSPAQAWLTIDHAANNVAAGDTVWIGSGVYRELVTMDTSGTSGNSISYIADIDGLETGDPGLVVISAYISQTDTTGYRVCCLDLNEKIYIEWHDVIFDGGNTATVYGAGSANWAMEGWVFDGCRMIAGCTQNQRAFHVDLNYGDTPTGNGLVIRNCTFMATLDIDHVLQNTAHENLKMTIENNIFFGHNGQSHAIDISAPSGAPTYSIGGIAVQNNTFIGLSRCINTAGLKDTANPVRFDNNRGWGVVQVAYGSHVALALRLSYNIISACGALIAGVATDDGNNDTSVAGLLVGGLADLSYYKNLGWSPYKPFEPIMLLDQTLQDPGIGAASATYAPADDMYGNVKPMGRNADDAGAVEARTRVEEETVAADAVAAFKGAGYHDMMAAVDAAETTFTVTGRYDSNYAGNLPIFRVLEIPGVADQSDVMTAAADTDETLSITFTPTSAGYVRLRLESRDTSANGEAYFKDLASA